MTSRSAIRFLRDLTNFALTTRATFGHAMKIAGGSSYRHLLEVADRGSDLAVGCRASQSVQNRHRQPSTHRT